MGIHRINGDVGGVNDAHAALEFVVVYIAITIFRQKTIRAAETNG